ncbi:MAG TPA: hypothetical protein PLZ15_05990 [Melioribacteraceae bacterium]|nr:hypothetical protein [Melioribacteraceae bacterium]
MSALIINATHIETGQIFKGLDFNSIYDVVFTVNSAREAQIILESIKIDIIIFFLDTPDSCFLNILFMKDDLPNKPQVVVCTNHKWPYYLNKYDQSAIDIICKPLPEELENALHLDSIK